MPWSKCYSYLLTETLQALIGTNRTGGQINVFSGNGTGIGVGGEFNLTAGNGGSTGNGATIAITAGSGGATSGNGGNINIQGGGIVGTGTGGRVSIKTLAQGLTTAVDRFLVNSCSAPSRAPS